MRIDRRLMPKMISSNTVVATDLRVSDRLANVISMFIAQNMPLMVTLAAALSSNTPCSTIAESHTAETVATAITNTTTSAVDTADVGSSNIQSLPISAVAPKVIAQVSAHWYILFHDACSCCGGCNVGCLAAMQTLSVEHMYGLTHISCHPELC
jgi:CYRIA/CYRIB Rac1 binding domain